MKKIINIRMLLTLWIPITMTMCNGGSPQEIEYKGHQAFKEKQYESAYKFFLKSAKKEDSPAKQAFRYRCAGVALSASNNSTEAIKMYALALKLDPTNEQYKNELKATLNRKGVSLKDILKEMKEIPGDVWKSIFKDSQRISISLFTDGWSNGANGGVLFYSENSKTIRIHISNPVMDVLNLKIKWNDQEAMDQTLNKGQKFTYNAELSGGLNYLDVQADKIFIPSDVIPGNNDKRTLGFRISIPELDKGEKPGKTKNKKKK